MNNMLLAVTGMSPQVITETLYALHQKGQVINELKIITTAKGKHELWQNLMVGRYGSKGVLLQLQDDYKLPPIAFSQSDILVITNEQGQPLDDIRTEDDDESTQQTAPLQVTFRRR